MKKYAPALIAVSCLLLLSSCGNAATSTVSGEVSTMDALRNSQPQKRADIMGTVKSITGNDFTVEIIDTGSSDVLKEMQDPEFRTKMQAMTDTERQALMTKMQEARANAKKILVEVTIPVGVPVLVRTGGAGGFWGGAFPGGAPGQWGAPGAGGATRTAWIGGALGTTWTTNTPRTNNSKQGTIADIKVGSSVNLWLAENTGDRKIASWVSSSAGQTTGTGAGGAGGFWGGGFGGGQAPAAGR